MKKGVTFFLVVTSVVLLVVAGSAKQGSAGSLGEEGFKSQCAICHPDGGNVVNSRKTLHKKDLDTNNVKTPDDIIKLMRNPGPGMPKFDDKAIPDKEAKEIAEYVLKTFK